MKSLDGMWDFRADVSSVGFEEMWYSLPLAQVNYSKSTNKYRKIQVISPGLIKLRKGFWVGL